MSSLMRGLSSPLARGSKNRFLTNGFKGRSEGLQEWEGVCSWLSADGCHENIREPSCLPHDLSMPDPTCTCMNICLRYPSPNSNSGLHLNKKGFFPIPSFFFLIWHKTFCLDYWVTFSVYTCKQGGKSPWYRHSHVSRVFYVYNRKSTETNQKHKNSSLPINLLCCQNIPLYRVFLAAPHVNLCVKIHTVCRMENPTPQYKSFTTSLL